MTDDLAQQLQQAQDRLAIIEDIDRIRDAAKEPTSMFASLVDMVAERFDAGLCLLVLIDRDLGHLELKAVNDREQALQKYGTETLRDLADRSLNELTITVWEEEDDHIAVVPIIMGEKLRLGTLLVFRDEPFDEAEHALLETAEQHIDSAIIQGYDLYELQLRHREIETIYRVDRIRDEQLPLEQMLSAVLDEIRRVIPSEMGFVMLHDQDSLEMRALSHDDLFRITTFQETITAYAQHALDSARMIYDNDVDEEDLRSLMAVPLILRSEIIGIFGLVNRYRPGGFDEADRRLLTAIASQMDTAIFESLEQRHLRNVLGRSVDPRVMERLLESRDTDFLKGERMTVTVLYADIRGSTDLAERTEPEHMVGFINDYLGEMAEIVLEFGGTLDKFVGDEVMALFGAPFPMPNHGLRAVQAGLAMQKAHTEVMERWKERGVDAQPIGIGIATGELIAGEMGSARRSDYTVLGPAANLGARICSAAGGGQVLISEETQKLAAGKIKSSIITGVRMKGIGDDVTIYKVEGLAS